MFGKSKDPVYRTGYTSTINNHIVHLVSFDWSVGVEDMYVSTAMRAQLRKPGACEVLSLEVKYDPASRLKCTATLIIDDTQYRRIAGSRVMMNTNLEQFLSRFLVANYIFITRNYNT
jgi:hypothetical protein